jgi:hypothetical protein
MIFPMTVLLGLALIAIAYADTTIKGTGPPACAQFVPRLVSAHEPA